MAAIDDLRAYTNRVYLVIKGRYFDDLTSDDGVNLVNQTIDWTNMFIDELETETQANGQPIDWRWVRTNGEQLGKALLGKASVDFDSDFNNLITEPNRYVQILQDGTAVSNWAVVAPDQISSKTERITEDMVALVGTTLVFSRAFHDYENGGTIVGDVTIPIPRLSLTNVDALSGENAVKPQQLLVLGAAKNASLPDIVQGGLSPSYVQRYTDLLNNAKARNAVSSISEEAARDNLGYIKGVGF